MRWYEQDEVNQEESEQNKVELFVDFNKNCSEYTQGLTDSDNVKIRYSLQSMT